MFRPPLPIAFAVLTLLVPVTSLHASTIPLELHVEPDGREEASGTPDDPLPSVAAAQHAVRRWKASHEWTEGPIVVWIHDGVYRLDEPLVFTPEDSGTQDAPIIYRAAQGESPILSGGDAITGWERADGGLWVARVEPAVEFNQLFVGGQRRPRARTPNEGYLRTDGPLVPAIPRWFDAGERKTGAEGFRVRPEDMRHWSDLDNLTVNVFHQWTHTMHWVKKLNEPSRVALFTNRFHWDFGYWETRQRYTLENTREALDVPGEWYHDRQTDLLYYMPLPGEEIDQIHAIVPRLDRIIEFAGRPEQGTFVEYVTLDGLAVEHARWRLGRREYQAFAQANDMLGHAAIVCRGTRNVSLIGCRIAHYGEHGIWFQEGSQNNMVRQCRVHDGGAGGVYIGQGGWKSRGHEPEDTNRRIHHITVDNCFIHDLTNVFRGAVGIWIGSASHNVITHNEICDMDYMGVNIGWCWSYRPTAAHHNLVAKNHIHHITRGVLTDTAGVYTLGVSPGTVVRDNVIHDVHGYPHHAHTHGLYNDEGSTAIVMEGNLVYRTSHAGYNRNHGRDLLVRNNLFYGCDDSAISVGASGQGLRIEQNVFVADTTHMIHSRGADDYRLRRNVYWSEAGEPDFLGLPLADWIETEYDEGSVVQEPQVAFDGDDPVGLEDESPAFDLGFKPLTVADAGLYGDEHWRRLPQSIERRPLELPDAPPTKTTIDETFENYLAEGEVDYPEFPLDPIVRVERAQEVIATTHTASGGKKSLKFVDRPSPRSFNPHMYWELEHGPGEYRFACDVRIDAEQPGELWFDFRDEQTADGKYISGPSVRISPQGEVSYRGKDFAQVPLGQWCTLTVRMHIGGESNRCDVTVVLPDGESVTIEKQYVPDDFDQLTWLGVLSLSKGAAITYLDNIRLHRIE